MNKFNIGDIVTGVKESTWASESEYKIKEIIQKDDNSIEYILDKINESDYCNYSVRWKEDQLKLVDKDRSNRELTFREIIIYWDSVKEDEMWENKNFTISKDVDGDLKLEHKDGFYDCSAIFFNPKDLFELQRKQYSFEEAFKAYEEGKEIESCEDGEVYNKLKEDKDMDKLFNASQIRGKWYINNK